MRNYRDSGAFSVAMILSQTACSLALMGLAASILVDCVALTVRAARRPGQPAPFEGVKMGLSRMLGRLLLALCVPGAVITIMILFVRSWDDNSRFNLVPLLFLGGIGLGVFMNSKLRPASYASYKPVVASQDAVRS